MNRLYMYLRTFALSTKLGRMLRRSRQMNSFTEEGARKVVDEYFGELSEAEKQEIVQDMLTEAREHNFYFSEYIMYHFEKRDQASRRLFVSTIERARYCERFNKAKNQMIFDDKGKTYKLFREFFQRDLIEVVGWKSSSKSKLEEFVLKHPRFIVKPFNGGNGIGIKIFDREEFDSFEALSKTLNYQYPAGFVAEELIRQVAELSAVHAASVNTLRIFTIRFDDRIEFLPFAWRVGRGNACVDNGGSGGIFCALDDNGVVVSTADEKGRFYDVHPDTQHPLIGFQLPRFEEAKQLACKLADVVPDNHYCGWDLALTDNGWVMQEGNWQGGVVAFQCPMQVGCRERLDEIAKELGV